MSRLQQNVTLEVTERRSQRGNEGQRGLGVEGSAGAGEAGSLLQGASVPSEAATKAPGG